VLTFDAILDPGSTPAPPPTDSLPGASGLTGRVVGNLNADENLALAA